MKKWLISLVFVPIMFMIAGGASADSLKIGVVDVQQILMRAPQVENINAKLQEEYAPRQQEIRDLEDSLQQDQERIYRDEATMTQSERAQVENRIQMTQREFQRKQEDYQQDLNLRQNQEMGQLVAQIREQISYIADSQNFDLILQKDMLPYASDRFDITQDVIDQLNQADSNG